MDKLSQRQWNDVAPRFINRHCPLCHNQNLSSEPRYGEVGGVDVLSVTCSKCGHIELFDVNVLRRTAETIHEEYCNNGLRKD